MVVVGGIGNQLAFGVASVIANLVDFRFGEQVVIECTVEACFLGLAPGEGLFCEVGTFRASRTAE